MNNMERVMVAVAGLAMVFAIALMFVTSGRYMDLQSLHVHDSKAGQPVAIAYDREFRRDFYGQWNVLSLIHISEPTRRHHVSRMPSSA